MIALIQDLKSLVNDEMKAAYLHGFKTAADEREKLEALLEGTLKIEAKPEADEMDFLKVAVDDGK